MGQEASKFLDCRFVQRDNSSEIKHQEILQDLRGMQRVREEKISVAKKGEEKLVGTQNSSVEKQFRGVARHDHILQYSQQPFPGSQQYRQGGFLEIPEISLSDVLEAKLNTTQYFPPNDINAMLGGLLSAMSYLQLNNISHHDIYPSSIYYSNSRYKLSHPISTQSSYDQTSNQTRFSYLSPELIQALIHGLKIDDHTLLFKPDVFSLGMVMLECCSLKSSSQCYDPENYSIVEANVANRLSFIEARYSKRVSSVIQNMLEFDPKSRMSATQVFDLFENGQRQAMGGSNSLRVDPEMIQIQYPPQSFVQHQIIPMGRQRSSLNPQLFPPRDTYHQPTRVSHHHPGGHQTIGPNVTTRPPTFDPSAFHNQPQSKQPLPQVNLQQIDKRIDRLLANSRNYT